MMEVVSGDNWPKSCKVPVKSSTPPKINTQRFYRPDALPVANQQCQSTEGKTSRGLAYPKLTFQLWLKGNVQHSLFFSVNYSVFGRIIQRRYFETDKVLQLTVLQAGCPSVANQQYQNTVRYCSVDPL